MSVNKWRWSCDPEICGCFAALLLPELNDTCYTDSHPQRLSYLHLNSQLHFLRKETIVDSTWIKCQHPRLGKVFKAVHINMAIGSPSLWIKREFPNESGDVVVMASWAGTQKEPTSTLCTKCFLEQELPLGKNCLPWQKLSPARKFWSHRQLNFEGGKKNEKQPYSLKR